MERVVDAMKRGLGINRYKKSARVVDESSLGSLGPDQSQEFNTKVNRFTAFLATVFSPSLSASCFSGQNNDMEDVWVSGERPRTYEMDHPMIRDSMRYAIYF